MAVCFYAGNINKGLEEREEMERRKRGKPGSSTLADFDATAAPQDWFCKALEVLTCKKSLSHCA